MIPNYPLTLMAITSLMQSQIFPSIEASQSNLSPYKIGRWNLAFEEPDVTLEFNVSIMMHIGA